MRAAKENDAFDSTFLVDDAGDDYFSVQFPGCEQETLDPDFLRIRLRRHLGLDVDEDE